MPLERDIDRERDDFERLRPDDEPASAAGHAGRAARYAEAVEEGRIDLRPRGVGEVLDQGLELLRARFATCVGLAAIAWIPIRVLTSMLLPKEVVTGEDFTQVLDQMGGSFAANLAVATGQLLVAALTARIVADVIEGRESRVGGTLRLAVTRLPGLIVIGVLAYCLMVVGMCMCLVPGFVLMWLLAPCAYIYILEGVNLRTAVRRSFLISCGRFFSSESFFGFWRWAGIMVVSTALVFPFSGLAAFAETPVMRDWTIDQIAISAPAYEALSVVIGSLFMGVAVAVQASILTVYYLDCRIRREGLDLETWIERLRPAPATAGSALP